MIGVQAGSILTLVTTPLFLSVRARKLVVPSLQQLAVGSIRSVAITTPLVILLGVARISQLETIDEVQDRLYRVHYNLGQRRTDRFSAVGAGIGGVIGAIAWRSSLGALRSTAGGAALGCAVGVFAHVASSQALSK